MNRTTLRKAIRKARYVFGWVVGTPHDGAYIQLVKGSCLATYDKHFENTIEINATLREDGDLYIG